MSRKGGTAPGIASSPGANAVAVAFSAVASAGLVALAAAPFSSRAVLAPLVFLSMVPALGLTLAIAVAERRFAPSLDRQRAQALLGAASGVVVLASACYFSSCLTIYGPFDPETYVIDGVGLLAGALLARRVGVWRALAIEVQGRGITPSSLAGLASGVVSATFFLADALVFPSGYFSVHEALWGVAVIALVVAVWLGLGVAMRAARPARRAARAALALVGAAVLAWPVLASPSGFRRALGDGTRRLALTGLISHRAFVAHLWRLLDRDGDGYAAHLGGSDCDDRDPARFPLAPGAGSRDCTGLLGAPSPRGESLMAVGSPSVHPRVILLISIDAFRCGFGEGEAPDLRDVCPALTALAREGRLRRDLHTPATQTRWALGALLGGSPSLARSFAARGLATVALPTCAYAKQAEGLDDFQSVDSSWIPRTHRAPPVIAPALHQAVRARALEALQGTGPPLLLWTHEMDTHAPYLAEESSRLVLSARAAYAADLRRTDAALGQLVRDLSLAARAPGDLWVVVTADHGEELGEHGLAFHGAQVYEESTRVPLLVWSSTPDHGAPFPAALPSSLEGIGAYLRAAWDGEPYVAAPTARSWAPLTGDLALVGWPHKVIFHPRLGLFELFDLSLDPAERAGQITAFGGGPTPPWARPLAAELVAGLRRDGRAPGGRL